mmetsp:Transcript_68305/g.142324  ORF Transcript_68305/g.142324 Transcript_68305/m.142324 type:complete len:252 (-) Transcript_68305:2238-2993(-)
MRLRSCTTSPWCSIPGQMTISSGFRTRTDRSFRRIWSSVSDSHGSSSFNTLTASSTSFTDRFGDPSRRSVNSVCTSDGHTERSFAIVSSSTHSWSTLYDGNFLTSSIIRSTLSGCSCGGVVNPAKNLARSLSSCSPAVCSSFLRASSAACVSACCFCSFSKEERASVSCFLSFSPSFFSVVTRSLAILSFFFACSSSCFTPSNCSASRALFSFASISCWLVSSSSAASRVALPSASFSFDLSSANSDLVPV